MNGITYMREWNPLLLYTQPFFGVEKAVGALFVGGEVGEGGVAEARNGDDDWGGVGKRRKCREGLLVLHNERSGWASQKRLVSWVPLRS